MSSFKIGKLLGKGSSSNVYETDPFEGKPAVVKRIDTTHKNIEWHMIVREINILKRLRGTPRFPQLYAAERPEGDRYVYLVMSRAPGVELLTHMEKLRRGLTLEETRPLIRELIAALRTLHVDFDLMHCDLKLENIFYDFETHQLTLLDLGLARSARDHKGCAGTPFYVAPESITYQIQTPLSDLWSLGVVIYTMWHGFYPFPSRDDRSPGWQEELGRRIRRGIVRGYLVPSDQIDLIERLLRKVPSERITLEQLLEHPVLKMPKAAELEAPELEAPEPSEVEPVSLAAASAATCDEASKCEASTGEASASTCGEASAGEASASTCGEASTGEASTCEASI